MISNELLLVSVIVINGLVLAMLVCGVRRLQSEFAQRWMGRVQTFQGEIAKMRGLVHEMRQRVEDAEKRADAMVPPPAPPSGLNLNRRAQAIRMLRRGAHAEQVSAALAIPRPQVDLLMKVNQLASSKDTAGSGYGSSGFNGN